MLLPRVIYKNTDQKDTSTGKVNGIQLLLLKEREDRAIYFSSNLGAVMAFAVLIKCDQC